MERCARAQPLHCFLIFFSQCNSTIKEDWEQLPLPLLLLRQSSQSPLLPQYWMQLLQTLGIASVVTLSQWSGVSAVFYTGVPISGLQMFPNLLRYTMCFQSYFVRIYEKAFIKQN